MKKQLLLKPLLALALVMLCGNAWGETKTHSWNLTESSDDWIASGNVEYFSQPYGYKKANGTLMNKNIPDFNTDNITDITVGFKCLQNGGTTSKLTVWLVDKDGNTLGNGIEITPTNATAASKTVIEYAVFSSANYATYYSAATGFMCKVTTFGKNILINGADYVITYTKPAYDVDIDNNVHGTIKSDCSSAKEGTIVSLSATAEDGYFFTAWDVKDANNNPIDVEDNKFTMPNCSVTVSATFTQIQSHDVTYYSYNSSSFQIGSEEVLTGEEITSAPTVEVPDGWEFEGWTENGDYTKGNVVPTLFNGVVTKDTQLFAVFSKANGDPIWQLATDNIGIGDVIIIAAKEYNYAISTTQTDNNRGQAKITKENNQASFDNDAGVQEITIMNGYKSGSFAFYVNEENTTGYLYAASSTKNQMKTQTTLNDNGSWKVSIASDATATITAQGSNTHNVMQYNSSSSLFSCYSSASQASLCIYKKQYSKLYSLKIFDVTISSAKYATICLPFNFTVPEDVTAYTAEVNSSKSSVNFNPIAEGAVIPAGMGIIISGEKGSYTFTGTANDATISNDGNDLIGSIAGETFSATGYTYYILSTGSNGVGFYWDIATEDEGKSAICAANKAVLAVPGASSSNVIRIEGITGIDTIEVAEEPAVIYDLMGRQVKAATNGIYIVNGKKMIIK